MRQLILQLKEPFFWMDFSNNLFLFVLPIVFFFLALNFPLFYFIFIPYFVFIFLKRNKKIFITIFIILSFLLIKTICYQKKYDINQYEGLNYSFYGKVIEIKEYESSYNQNNYYRYTIKTNTNLKNQKNDLCIPIKGYVYSNELYKIGDCILGSGIIKEIDGETIEHAFNYEAYLNHAKITFSLQSNDTTLESHQSSLYLLKKIVNNYFDRHFEGNTNILLKGLVLGDSSGFSEDFDLALKENGILHLFAVSGLHISLFITMLGTVLSLLKIEERKKENIILLFLGFYIIVTSFAVSIVRAGLMYFFGIFNKRKCNQIFSSLDVVSFTFILLLIINPYYAYNTGFILSFMVSFIIVLISSLVKHYSNSTQILIISILSNLGTIPVIININYEYNLLTPVLNVLYINLVSLFILPFSFITIVFPILSYALDSIFDLFIHLVNFTSNIHLNIHLPYFNGIRILIFYLLIFLIILFFDFKKKRRIVCATLLFFLLFLSFFSAYSIEPQIDFLYCEDGDATLIRYQSTIILIDAGNGNRDEVLNYLRSLGVRKIDYLIITHAHDDHYGGVNKIREEIKINKIITSNLYPIYYENQIQIDCKQEYELHLKGIEILFLSPRKDYNYENANSLVFLMQIQNKKILFTGDATIEAEQDYVPFLKKLGIEEIDILKVAHHGSSTSTGEELIQSLKIDYAVIMVGKTRKETLPNKETIDRLEKNQISVYNTLKCYSIHIKIKNNRIEIKTLK